MKSSLDTFLLNDPFLFANNPNVTTFSGTFYNCSGLTGSAPELWVDTATKFPDLFSTTGCFTGTAGLDNYSIIPAAWR